MTTAKKSAEGKEKKIVDEDRSIACSISMHGSDKNETTEQMYKQTKFRRREKTRDKMVRADTLFQGSAYLINPMPSWTSQRVNCSICSFMSCCLYQENEKPFVR